ncbi:hypothetical protein GV792_03180 [Nocardia cyriacigeorgica]|uniref:Uncharacterized protein n=1 Tax=Nocardia cyriacigeorgica TaxID=135487 RepID=A0A6P1D685_9NOCA|nr:hypothetical protein [Nocardia cyriacigeorgica]NEW37569.1 hypothetical protein [Nocardia cyriacigeorgica]NEW45011.1 hypothetical protein [Nocardia cyriacigeorgica]NEW49043.1 hypothetical protein [Nocardia cyriacigeorgica]
MKPISMVVGGIFAAGIAASVIEPGVAAAVPANDPWPDVTSESEVSLRGTDWALYRIEPASGAGREIAAKTILRIDPEGAAGVSGFHLDCEWDEGSAIVAIEQTAAQRILMFSDRRWEWAHGDSDGAGLPYRDHSELWALMQGAARADVDRDVLTLTDLDTGAVLRFRGAR